MPVLVIGAFVAAARRARSVVAAFSGGFILVVPVATGLSIARYRLYDVDRLLSRAVTYAVLTLLLAAIYVGTVLFAVWSLRSLAGRSQVATAVATLATAAAAAPARRWLQAAVDRRFSAVGSPHWPIVRTALSGVGRGPRSGRGAARGARGSRPAGGLPGPARHQWVTAAGTSVEPAVDEVAVRRFGESVASIAFDPSPGRPSARRVGRGRGRSRAGQRRAPGRGGAPAGGGA